MATVDSRRNVHHGMAAMLLNSAVCKRHANWQDLESSSPLMSLTARLHNRPALVEKDMCYIVRRV